MAAQVMAMKKTYGRKPKLPKSPSGLSAISRQWWKKLHTDYELNDSAAMLILEEALRALDRVLAARAAIDKHGVLSPDKWGQLKPNPACVIERDARAQMLMALRALNLSIEPLADRPGRQPGG